METVTPFKEIIDAIKASGGDAFKYCYQCGMCDTVCPWNRVRNFSMRKLVREAIFAKGVALGTQVRAHPADWLHRLGKNIVFGGDPAQGHP